MDPRAAIGLATACLAAYYIYLILKLRLRAAREELQRLGFSFGALILLAFILTLNAAEFAAQVGGNPLWTDYTLTRRLGEQMVEAAEGAIKRYLGAARTLAVLNAVSMVAFWVTAAVSGGLTLLASWLVNLGVEMLLALMRATIMAAQAVWATGRFYIFIADLAPYFRALAPLGVALMTAPRLRRGGAGLFALGVLLGYAAPYALNAAAAAASLESLKLPEQYGNPEPQTPGVIALVQLVPLRDGGSTPQYLPPGALVVIEAPEGLAVRPAGSLTALPLEFTVRRVALTNAFIPSKPEHVRVPLKGAINCTAHGNLTRIEDCVWVDYPVVNLTIPPGLFVAGDRRGWGWVLNVTGRYAVDLRLTDPHVSWYAKRHPSFDSRVAVILAPGWGAAEQFNCSVWVDGARVNTTCIRVLVRLRGSLSSYYVVERDGYGMVEVNGTPRVLRANLTVLREPAPGLEPSNWAAALAFNASARLLNASMPPGCVQISYATVGGARLAERVTLVDVYRLRGSGPDVLKTLRSPLSWPQPPPAATVTVEAVYPGRLLAPATVVFALEPYGVPADDGATLIFDDPIVGILDRAPLLSEYARNWLNIYPFLTLAALLFGAAVMCCDILSGLLEGPSILMRFTPSRWRGAYWGVAVGAVVTGIISFLRGPVLPSGRGPFLGKYEDLLKLRRSALEEWLQQKFPLRRLEQALKEQARAQLAPRLERVAFELQSAQSRIADTLRRAAEQAAQQGLRRAAVYSALSRIAGARSPYAILAAAARFSWELFERRNVPLGAAVLGAAAATLRGEAYKRYGSMAPILAPRMILAAQALDTARVLVSQRSLMQRLVVRAALDSRFVPVQEALQRVSAMNVVALARLAAVASGNEELIKRVEELHRKLWWAEVKPKEAVAEAVKIWRLCEKQVEPWLKDMKVLVEDLLAAAKAAAEGGTAKEVGELLRITEELERWLGQLKVEEPPHIAKQIREVRDLVVQARLTLALGLSALDAAERAVEQARRIVKMPPLAPHEKLTEPVAGWEKWLAAAGFPLETAYRLGEKLNLTPGTLLDSAVALLKEAPGELRERAIAAIENALKETGDPRLRGLLDAVRGVLPDGAKVLEELKQGRVMYAVGYAAWDPEALAAALALHIANETATDELAAKQGALLALRKLLGEDVEVPIAAAPAFNYVLDLIERKVSAWQRLFEEAGIPAALAKVLEPRESGDRFEIVRALKVAYEQGFGQEAAKAVEAAAARLEEVGKAVESQLVRGALDAARGRLLKPGEALELVKAGDEYAVGYAIVAPELMAKALGPGLSELLGIPKSAAERGALAAIRSHLLFERVEERLDEQAEAARKFVSLALTEAAWGVKGLSQEAADALTELSRCRIELAEAIARYDVEKAAEAVSRGLDAMIALRDHRAELKEKLPPAAYERLISELREWRVLHERMLDALDACASFFESLADLQPPAKPAHAELAEMAVSEATKLPRLEEVVRDALGKRAAVDLYDAVRVLPEEAPKLLDKADDFARGALKAKIGEPPEGPEERLGKLYHDRDKLDLPKEARDAIREAIEAMYESGLMPEQEAAQRMSEELEKAVQGNLEAVGRYLVMAAILGVEPQDALRELHERASGEAARAEIEAAVMAKRAEREVERLREMVASLDDALQGALENLGVKAFEWTGGPVTSMIMESVARAEKERALEALNELRRIEAGYREALVLARTPEEREGVAGRLRFVSELIAALEGFIGE